MKGRAFENLVQSLRDFPKMLWIRPLVVDGSGMVLGGNARLKALKKLKVKEVPTISADDLSEEEKQRFIIADNVQWGDWDMDRLANEWDLSALEEWGLSFPNLDAADMPDDVLPPAAGVEKQEPDERMKKLTFVLKESDYKALTARLAELHDVREVAIMLLISASEI